MPTMLDQTFFNRSVLDVAPDLLGKQLVRKLDNGLMILTITEVEAYDGPHDLACHGRFGKTKRTEAMFGPAGHFYVYLIYGLHWMLNLVTNDDGYPAAVLIRGTQEVCGPARLTKHLNLDKSFNTKVIAPETGLWVQDSGIIVPKEHIITTPRIGIDYAGPEWSIKPYRFILNNQ